MRGPFGRQPNCGRFRHTAADGPAIGLIYGNGNKIYMTSIPHVWVLEDTDGDGKADYRRRVTLGGVEPDRLMPPGVIDVAEERRLGIDR